MGIQNTSGYEDVITQKQNQESGLTTEDNRMREALL